LADAGLEKTPTPLAIRSREAVEVSEALLAEIVRLASEAIIGIDGVQHITFFNEGAEAIFGFASAEIVGQPLSRLIPQSLRAGYHEDIRRFAEATQTRRRMGERREIVVLRRDGEERTAEASITCVQERGRKTLAVVLRDVTEARRAESIIRELYRKSQLAIAARDEVLTLVAHDLRNPLHGVLLRIEALCSRGDAAARGTLDAIRLSIGHMDRMIQDLMDIARVEADRLWLSRSAGRPASIVEEVAAVYRPIASRDHVDLRIETGVDLPAISVDRTRIVRVLLNLLANASKFGGPDPVVTLAVTGVPGGVRFAVSDNGEGMAPEQIEHVFDRFWQADASDARGLGLGLAICRAIVEAHGGRIVVESVPGRGSTFSFVIAVASSADRLAW
jgi:PAS domain S-box-containing protein